MEDISDNVFVHRAKLFVNGLWAAGCPSLVTFNSQAGYRIVMNLMASWCVIVSWIMFIVVASAQGMIWYLVLPGLLATSLYLGSLVYIIGLVKWATKDRKVTLNMQEYEPRASAETIILVTAIIGALPITIAMMFMLIDHHNGHDKSASTAATVQNFLIYIATIFLWVPYGCCANPRQFFDGSSSGSIF